MARVERTAGLLPALLSITGADLDRVAAFLKTARAQRLHGELRSLEERLTTGLPGVPWNEIGPLELFAILAWAAEMQWAREHGFPAGTPDRPQERLLALLYQLILAAEDAGQPALALAGRAVAALLFAPGAARELDRRAASRLGATAAAIPLLDEMHDRAGADALRRILRRAGVSHLPVLRRGREEREELDGQITEEIARRLRGRSDPADLAAAVFEALAPGPRATPWDYVARDAGMTTRERIARERGAPSEVYDEALGQGANRRSPERRAAAIEELFRLLATPQGQAAAEIATGERQGDVARRHGKTSRTIRAWLDAFRQP